MAPRADAVKRVGIFGGSFDPVHVGHVALARAALDQLQVDEIRWMPVGSAWQKQHPLAPAHHRVAMLELAIADEPRHVIDRCEVDRAGPTYTIDTLESLTARHPEVEWTLVLGQDQLAALPTWHRWQAVVRAAEMAVVARDFRPPEPDRLLVDAGLRLRVLQMPPVAVSSSEVRRRIQARALLDEWVPGDVARYIDRHGLYRGATSGS